MIAGAEMMRPTGLPHFWQLAIDSSLMLCFNSNVIEHSSQRYS